MSNSGMVKSKGIYYPTPELFYGTEKQKKYVKFIENWVEIDYRGRTYKELCDYIENYKDAAWANFESYREDFYDALESMDADDMSRCGLY